MSYFSKTTGTVFDYLMGLERGVNVSDIGKTFGVGRTAVSRALERAKLPSGLKAYAEWIAAGNVPPSALFVGPPAPVVPVAQVRAPCKLSMRMIHSSCVEEGDCLVWNGARTYINGSDRNGYPTGYHEGKKVLLRRLVWELTNAKSTPKGYVVVAKCGGRLCLNPAHIEAIPKAEHGKRLSQAGAYSSPAATAAKTRAVRARANLSAEKAAAIRASSEATAVLADRYSVSHSTIRMVRNGRIWADKPRTMVANSVFALGGQRIVQVLDDEEAMA
jgi:hypothetical protein